MKYSYNNRPMVDVYLKAYAYDDIHLLEAVWADTMEPLTDDELQELTDDYDWCHEAYINQVS